MYSKFFQLSNAEGSYSAESSQALLASLKSLSSALPNDIKEKLGGFSWEQRLHTLDSSGGKPQVRFFSDGLDLKTKTSVETLLKDFASKKSDVANLGVYMEAKEKSAKPAQAPQQRPPQSQGAPAPHTHAAPSSKKAIPGVKNIIAVASGKGGVGKSTVSVNLALALYQQGYKVGILDADIYGPSMPMMLGVNQDPVVNEQNKIVPPEAYGLKVMSFGFFAGEDTAVIWRGPMVMKALQQFFYDVEWGTLDYLVIDLPPGTGDAQLTLVQSLPISGAVIVTTPQNVALLDAVKGIVMFRKTEVPIIGVVENMSTFVCPSCKTESHIFGEGGGAKVSKKFDVPVLGHVPLVSEIRVAGDEGKPLTLKEGDPMRIRFNDIAQNVVARLVDISKTSGKRSVFN